MQSTLTIFEDRKKEIFFYYSIMLDISNGDANIKTIDNLKFFKIMKSNFLLMLYNLVEACIVSGMLEIYDNLRCERCSYDSVIDEIRLLWSKHMINQIYGPSTGRAAYENRVQVIIDNIVSKHPIVLSKDALGISGNLDARMIKTICDQHRIRYSLRSDGHSLQRVKDYRNNLAHGDVSFSECARDLTINDLETIQDEVFDFLSQILAGMTRYHDEKRYKTS